MTGAFEWRHVRRPLRERHPFHRTFELAATVHGNHQLNIGCGIRAVKGRGRALRGLLFNWRRQLHISGQRRAQQERWPLGHVTCHPEGFPLTRASNPVLTRILRPPAPAWPRCSTIGGSLVLERRRTADLCDRQMEPAAARQALPGGAVPSYPAGDQLEPRAAETRSRAPRRVPYPLQHPAGRRRPTSAATS